MQFITMIRRTRENQTDTSSLGISAKRDVLDNKIAYLDVIGNLPHNAGIRPRDINDAAYLVAWIRESFPLLSDKIIGDARVVIRRDRDQCRDT